MKWAIIISVALFITSAELRDIHRSARDTELRSKICGHIKITGKEEFERVIVFHIAQNLQQSDCPDLKKISEKFSALAEKCCADEASDPHCLQTELDILEDTICAAQAEVAKNHWIATCCSKAGAERHECLVKGKPSGDPTHFPVSSEEEQCKSYTADTNAFLSNLICESAKRFPRDPATNSMIITSGYGNILETCCTNETLKECFQSKKAVWKEKKRFRIAKLRSNCQIIKKYGIQVLQAKKLAGMSMKFPLVDFQTQVEHTKKIVDMHKTCCEGDSFNCMTKRYNLINGVCADHENVAKSKQLTECCKQPPIRRSLCIDNITPEPKPEGLDERLPEYVEDKEICKKYELDKTSFLAKFLHDFSRIHTDFSVQMQLRIAKTFQDLLEQCCSSADPVTCLSQAEEMLKVGIAKNKELADSRCHIYEKVGKDAFENVLLATYTKKLPTAPLEKLREASSAIAKAAAKCCPLENFKRNACSEDIISIVVGELCDNIGSLSVSPKILACCKESYSRVRPCITEFDHDDTFQPPPLDEKKFSFHADLCTLPKDKLHDRKAELLHDLVLAKPSITNDQIKASITAFYTITQTCCKSPSPDVCFSTEGPKTVAHVKALLGL